MKATLRNPVSWLLVAALSLFLLNPMLAGAAEEEESFRFPGDPPEHHIVYQFNKADWEYQEHILNSISAMLTKYGDNVEIAVVAIGPGIHVLAERPERTVPELIKQRARSMAENYGVRWIACGNTMNSIGWSMEDMEDYADYVDVGAAALMELQEEGFAYVAW